MQKCSADAIYKVQRDPNSELYKGGNGNYVSIDIIYFSPRQRRTAFNVCPRIGFKFLLKMLAAGSAGSFVSSVSVFQSAIPAISLGLSDGEMSGGQEA